MRLATVLLFLLLSVPTSAQSLNNQAIEKWIVAFPEINAFLTQHRGPLKQYISEQYGITGGMETFNKIAPDKNRQHDHKRHRSVTVGRSVSPNFCRDTIMTTAKSP